MEQVIIGGYNDALNYANTTAEYNSLQGGRAWSATENTCYQVVPTAGTLTNLYVELSVDPTHVGSSYTFTVMLNSAPSALTLVVEAGTTTDRDIANSVSVVAGDTISLRCVATDTDPDSAIAKWSVMFTGTTAKESVNFSRTTSLDTTGNIAYVQGCGAQDSLSYSRQIIPTGGTFKNLYLKAPSAPTSTYTVTLYVNDVATSLTATITNPATTANNTVNTVAVVAGDTVYYDLAEGTTETLVVCAGVTFEAATDGESLVLGMSSGSQSNSAVNYNYLATTLYSSAWGTTESLMAQGNQANTFKKLWARRADSVGNTTTLGATPKTYTFNFRNNAGNAGSPGNIAVTLGEVQQRVPTGDSSHSTNVTDSDADNINWDDVDEITPNAADYITLVSNSDECIFTYSAFTIPAGSVIGSVTVYSQHKNDGSASSRSGSVLLVNGSKYYVQSAAFTTSGGAWTDIANSWTTNPNTAAAWTVADVNGTGANPLQAFGVYASDATPDVLISACYIVVNIIGSFDTTNEYTISDYDNLAIMSTPAGTPAGRAVYWSLVGYIEPTAGGATWNETLTEGIKTGDTLTPAQVLGLLLTDGIKGGDTLTPAQILSVLLSDGIKAGDSIINLGVFGHTLTDGLKAGDNVVVGQVLGLIVTDGITGGDTLSNLVSLYDSLTDGLNLADVVSLGNQIYNETLSDGINAGDALTNLVTLYNLLTDGVKVGDVSLSQAEFSDLITDGIKNSDILLVSQVLGVMITDGLKAGDSILIGQVLGIILTEGIKTGDTSLSQGVFGDSLIDGIKTGDSLTAGQVLGLILTDGIKAGDTLTPSQVLGILLIDGIKLSDLITLGSETYNMFITDGIKASDTITPSQILNVILSDGAKLTDTPISQLAFNNSLTDGAKLGDSSLSQLLFNITLSDGVKLGDTSLSRLVANYQLTDGIKLNDSLAVSAVLNAILTDGIKVSDTQINQLVLSLLLSDGVKLSDATLVGNVYSLLLSDGIKLSDTVIEKLIFGLSLTDGIKLADILSLHSILRSRRYGDSAPVDISSITTRAGDRYGESNPSDASIITTKPVGSGRYG